MSRSLPASEPGFGIRFVTRAVLAAGLALVVAAGCSVGPNYHRPQPAIPADWRGAPGDVTTNPPAQLAEWWTVLRDSELDALIARAGRANNDLKAAEARVRGARALRGAAIADLLPTLGASASRTSARRSRNSLSFPVQLLDTDTYQAGFDATWEIDVFGGKRRALQAAVADLQAVEENRRAVLVSLLAEVARNYVEFRGTQRRLVIARDNLAAEREVLGITRMRFEKGLASELDVAQASALLASTKSQIPSLEVALKQSSHRLSVLLGEPPGSLEAELDPGAPIPLAPTEVPAGLPADLLRRRPDVRQSERQLAGATARIGVATAELFPKFFLTGNAGYQSLDAGNLIEPASKFWSAGPSVRWRLLEYPRLKAQIKAQTAQQEQALAQFNQIVLTSLEEVENALVAYGKERERFVSLSESVVASQRALDLANQLYTAGLGEFLSVLVAERTLYEAQDAQVLSQRAITENLIALYKALGGGWDPAATTH